MYIIGENHQVIRHGPLRVWAENGMVRIEDSRDNSYEVISVRECALRANALNDMIKNTMSSNPLYDAHAIVELQRVLEGYTTVMRKAQEQGMPTDKSAIADLKRRRATTVSMAQSRSKPTAITQTIDMTEFGL